jgi:hypothetical protein
MIELPSQSHDLNAEPQICESVVKAVLIEVWRDEAVRKVEEYQPADLRGEAAQRVGLRGEVALKAEEYRRVDPNDDHPK